MGVSPLYSIPLQKTLVWITVIAHFYTIWTNNLDDIPETIFVLILDYEKDWMSLFECVCENA